jgi:uncharacterized protein YjbI with pentapeptide repeats
MEENRGAKLADPEHVEILKQGAAFWNVWRKKYADVVPDLRGLDSNELLRTQSSDAKKEYSNPSGLMDLSGIDFSQARLRGSQWRHLNLIGADFSNARLTLVSLRSCSLNSACFIGANVFYSIFDHCKLSQADFSMAPFAYSAFLSCNLGDAIGLEKTTHAGPSTIGIDTVFESKGRIPESFLRGCGVPEDFIKFIPSLTGQPFEFYKCFISHSSSDMDFCKRLHADLQNEGVRVWFFPEDARTGCGVWDEIDKNIKIYDKLMVVCSEKSLQSEPVLREIERALQREDRERKPILFPIAIDSYIFDEWDHPRKADVLAKVVGDFSNWKDHDSYKDAFDRLMRDLKASEE